MNRRQALKSAVAEAFPRRLRAIAPSRNERQRARRAEDRDLPVQVRKQDCPGCVAAMIADPEYRWPIGDCSPECRRRAARRAS